MLSPQLADRAHPAAVGLCPVEKLLDQHRPVVARNEVAQRIGVFDAVRGEEGETGTATGLLPRLGEALEDGERLRADEGRIDEVHVTEATAGLDVPFHLVVVGRDPFGPRPRDGRIVADDDVVEGLWAVGLEGHFDDARGVVEQVERVLPEHARLVVVAMPSRQHRIGHGLAPGSGQRKLRAEQRAPGLQRVALAPLAGEIDRVCGLLLGRTQQVARALLATPPEVVWFLM